jgi:hypothetical protein
MDSIDEIVAEKSSRRFVMCHPIVRVLLANVVSLVSTPVTQAQDLLSQVNSTFYQRLETCLRYQEAVLPAGKSAVHHYLQIGKRQFLLESLQTVASTKDRIREHYVLTTTCTDTLSVSRAQYRLSNNLNRGEQQVATGAFYNYPTLYPYYIEAGMTLVRQEFNPWDILHLQPGKARSGQVVYVQNTAPDFSGDTLACYTLTRTGDTYQILLQERRNRANRRWRHNAKTACYWKVDVVQRRVSATISVGDDVGNLLSWERTYTNETDFLETSTSTGPKTWLGDDENTAILYNRTFQQKTPTMSLDRYTIPSLKEKGEPNVVFSIISHYQ